MTKKVECCRISVCIRQNNAVWIDSHGRCSNLHTPLRGEQLPCVNSHGFILPNTDANSTIFDFLVIFCSSRVYSLVPGVWHFFRLLCSCCFYRTYLDTLAIDSHRNHIFLSTFHARHINHPNSVPIVFVTTSSNCKNPV